MSFTSRNFKAELTATSSAYVGINSAPGALPVASGHAIRGHRSGNRSLWSCDPLRRWAQIICVTKTDERVCRSLIECFSVVAAGASGFFTLIQLFETFHRAAAARRLVL